MGRKLMNLWRMERLCLSMVLCCFYMVSSAQTYYEIVVDEKTAAQIGVNTAAAFAQEDFYKKSTDSILMRTSSILASSLVKQSMKDMDMNARKNLSGFARDGALYAMFVDETAMLVSAMTSFLKNAAKYPHGTLTCYKSVTMVMLEAKALVKEAVVVGFGGKVPNPFKVDRDKLKKGTDNTPAYNDDAKEKESNGKKASDGANLLLPDERYRIIENTIFRIRQLRQATVSATWKLKCDYGWREMLWAASPYWATRVQNIETAVNMTKRDLENIPGW